MLFVSSKVQGGASRVADMVVVWDDKMKTTQRATIIAASWTSKLRGNTWKHYRKTAELKMNTNTIEQDRLTVGVECNSFVLFLLASYLPEMLLYMRQ